MPPQIESISYRDGSFNSTSASLSDVVLTVSAEAGVRTAINIAKLKVNFDLSALPSNPLIDIELNGATFSGEIPNSTAVILNSSVKFEGDLAGQLTINRNAEGWRILPATFSLKPAELDLKQGQINLTPLELKLSEGTLIDGRATVIGEIRGQGSKAKLFELPIKGLDLRVPFRFDQSLITTTPASIKGEFGDAPFGLERFSLLFSLLSGDRLRIKDAKIAVLRGEVLIADMKLGPPFSDWSTSAEIRGINLEELLKLYPQDRVQADGHLSGSVQIAHSDKGGFTVPSGELNSHSGGGRISYNHPLEETGPEHLKETFEVLKNFRYSSLHASITVDSEYKLLLGLKLAGSNPQFQNGRDVDLAINIEDNLAALFKSIRLASGDF